MGKSLTKQDKRLIKTYIDSNPIKAVESFDLQEKRILFRSKYFQYLIEINKKGLGNNTNIFPNQIQELPIPDISLSEQQRIIDMINAELNKQDIINIKISEKKSEIEQILLNITK